MSATGDRMNLKRTGREAEFPPVQGLARGPRVNRQQLAAWKVSFSSCVRRGFLEGFVPRTGLGI